jgi:flagellar biogenesis protein FliO
MFRPTNNFPPPAMNPFGSLTAWRALCRRVFAGFNRRADAPSALEHVASLPLTTHASVALVRFNKETLLLGITPQGITLLSRACDETALTTGAGSEPIPVSQSNCNRFPESTAR